MTDQRTQVIEPLAKFHTQVISKYRVVIPDGERLLFGLDKGEYVEIIIRKIDPATLKVLKRAHTLVKLTTRGMFTINKNLRKELNIDIGDIIEIVLLNHYSLKDLLREEYTHLLAFVDNRYEIIDEVREYELISSSKKVSY